MNELTMSLAGSDALGWTWAVQVDDLALFRTEPLVRDDLASALFSIQRDSSRTTPSFCGLSDEDLFLVLDGFFSGALYEALRPSAEEHVWAKHLVSPSVPAILSSRMYLVDSHRGSERLLVRQDTGRRVFDIAKGSFDRQLAQLRDRLDDETSR
jgi:hypothetical protein